MPAAQPKLILIGFVVAVIQFGIAILAFGGWTAFFSHSALIALAAITIALMMVAPFTSGNVSPGEKEDRGNRWVFKAFTVIALLSAFLPPWMDRANILTIDGERTRWVGVLLYSLGGMLRLWPVFVLGKRFSGLVAIQSGHRLETHGIYRVVRNPSYLGMLINMLGWGLAFRGWTGVFIALTLLIPLVPRMRAEERLLREHFGAEYDAYVARTLAAGAGNLLEQIRVRARTRLRLPERKRKNENARVLAASGVFRVPHSSSDQTPSGLSDDESSVAAVRYRHPAKPSVPYPISLGSPFIGQAADEFPISIFHCTYR